jgi:hypothetical protein
MIGLKADAGDNFKNRATIPLAPCTYMRLSVIHGFISIIEGKGNILDGNVFFLFIERMSCGYFGLY